MADPVGDIIGDYRGFVAQQHARLLARGINIRPYPLSHLAVRVPEEAVMARPTGVKRAIPIPMRGA